MPKVMKPPRNKIPRHVAFIMDGNGRWAEARGLARTEGHVAGTQAVIRTVENAFRAGVEYITLYAFSSENWNRPAEEIRALMEILIRFLAEQEAVFLKNEIRLETIGDLGAFPQNVRDAIEAEKAKTANFSARTVIVALNYGSRAEILRAAKNYAEDVRRGNAAEPLDWEHFCRYLWTADIPDPDLIVRTSGESRLSNFLMLQGAYAELYFTDTLWPDFDSAALDAAFEFYATRERRFGKTSAQLKNSA